MRKTTSGGLVYSTDGGRMCPDCRRPEGECLCTRKPPTAKGDGIVRLSRETKGRGGKAVTLVRGVPLDDAGLAALGKRLRSACGSGGMVKDGTIEIQGDHCARLLELLAKEGWPVKRAGG